MKDAKIKEIVYLNLILYLAFSILELVVVTLFILKLENKVLSFMVMSMFSIGFQVFMNIIFSIHSFLNRNSEQGKSYLLSLLIILLIGCPLCFSGLFLVR
jgi:hypothetical protein